MPMTKTPVGEIAALTVKIPLTHNTHNQNQLFRKEASIDACE